MEDKTILLAEDDPGHEELFRQALAHSGIECRMDVVRDGAEVIEYLFTTGKYKDRDPAEMPSLLLLDLNMPRMNGLQVLQVLRRVRGEDCGRYPPVVVLTCSEADQDVADAYRLGAQSYIRKPSEFADFADAVRETVHYWLGLNRPVPAERMIRGVVHEGL